MGRSKPALGYKPQAKTAHIKRVYPGELPPLPPSYEAAVSQHHQQQRNNFRYSSGHHGHAMQPPIYSSPAINEAAFVSHAPLVQQPMYSVPAIQQSMPINNGIGWDAWSAKLVEEEKYYGGRFFEMNRPMEINAFNNVNASNCFFNAPLGTIGDDIRDVVMITPSPSVVSMDVDIDPFAMSVDDPNAMDIDYVIVTSDDTAGFAETLPPILPSTSEHSQRSPCKCQQRQPQHQNPPKRQQQPPQQQQQQQQQKSKHQNPPTFIPARSKYAPEVAEVPPLFPARPCLPMPKPKTTVSPSKQPENVISTKVITKTANCTATTCGRTTTTKNVERLVESFRRLNLSDTFIHRSKPSLDRNDVRTVARPSSTHGVKAISSIALAPTVTPEVALVTFSCDDLVSLGSPRPPTLSGVWEDLAGLEKAFVPAPPLVDDSVVTQAPLPSSANTYGSEYSHIFELRDIDWSLVSSAAPDYQEQVSFSTVVSVDQRGSIHGYGSPKRTTPSNKLKILKNTTRRYSTKRQKKTLVLGLPLNTLQQTRRKKKLAPCSSAKVVKLTKKVDDTMTAPFNGVIDTNKSSTEQESNHDLLIKKALNNSRLYIPRRSPFVNKPTSSKVILDAPPKVVSILDAGAPEGSRLCTSSADDSNVRSSLPTPPISPIREPRVRRRTSYTSFTTSFAIAPSSPTIGETESSDLGGNENLLSSAPSPPAPRRRRVNDARIYGRDYGREYISYSLSFSVVPSIDNLKGLAGTSQETPATVLPQLAEPLHVPEVDDKVFPGAFPKVQKLIEECHGPSIFEWLTHKVLGW